MTKLKNSKGEKTKEIELWQNSNCDKTQKTKCVTNPKLWGNLKTQNVTKVRKSNCDKSKKEKYKKYGKTQKLKLWEISETQIVTKLAHLSCDKT